MYGVKLQFLLQTNLFTCYPQFIASAQHSEFDHRIGASVLGIVYCTKLCVFIKFTKIAPDF